MQSQIFCSCRAAGFSLEPLAIRARLLQARWNKALQRLSGKQTPIFRWFLAPCPVFYSFFLKEMLSEAPNNLDFHSACISFLQCNINKGGVCASSKYVLFFVSPLLLPKICEQNLNSHFSRRAALVLYLHALKNTKLQPQPDCWMKQFYRLLNSELGMFQRLLL